MGRGDRAMRFDVEYIAFGRGFDLGEQVFVCRYAQRRRPRPPLDLVSATGFYPRKRCDRTLLSRDVAVAANAAPVAPGEDDEQEQKRAMEQILFHESSLVIEMPEAVHLDSKKCERIGLT